MVLILAYYFVIGWRGKVWKNALEACGAVVTIFLASLLNAPGTNTYAVDIPHFSCHNTREEDTVVDCNSGLFNHAT